jgi:hypothetical protein
LLGFADRMRSRPPTGEVPEQGIEPRTRGSSGHRSTAELLWRIGLCWHGRQDSNPDLLGWGQICCRCTTPVRVSLAVSLCVSICRAGGDGQHRARMRGVEPPLSWFEARRALHCATSGKWRPAPAPLGRHVPGVPTARTSSPSPGRGPRPGPARPRGPTSGAGARRTWCGSASRHGRRLEEQESNLHARGQSPLPYRLGNPRIMHKQKRASRWLAVRACLVAAGPLFRLRVCSARPGGPSALGEIGQKASHPARALSGDAIIRRHAGVIIAALPRPRETHKAGGRRP